MASGDVRPSAEEAMRAALHAGERAPSVHGTRPWRLGYDGTRIAVSSNVDQRLDIADPDARELVISCGAALYNIRVALRAHGVVPDVAVLPDPEERPGLLAEITSAERDTPDDLDRLLFTAVGERRTHRGPFVADIDDSRLSRVLRSAASAEGAALLPVTAESLVRSLAGLVAAAEYAHRHERAHRDELSRWVRASEDRYAEGVSAADFPAQEPETLFPGRDYGAGRVRGTLEPRGEATGTVALLTTSADTREGHLAAGQALQRVLLAATAAGYSAALHTQPLEEPPLRAFLTERFCGGAHPQMLMRLGRLHERPPERERAIDTMLTGV